MSITTTEPEILPFAVRLTCKKCTKQGTFKGHTEKNACNRAVAAGWVADRDATFVCPKCPAFRGKHD